MLDIIFPSFCVSCNQYSPKGQLCSSCSSDIKFIKSKDVCHCCGVPFNYFDESVNTPKHKCSYCINQKVHYTVCRSIAYLEGTVRELLHGFKYRKKLGIGKLFTKLMTENFPEELLGFDLIMPVPLHINKLREREYNQSAVLVNGVSKKLICEKDLFSLVKSRETEPQVNFKNSNIRKKNISKSFSVRDVKKVKKRSILLVDDVYTSGSTVNECARVLLDSGAEEVRVLTLLRAVDI